MQSCVSVKVSHTVYARLSGFNRPSCGASPAVNLTEVFTNRAHVMRSVPAMLKGAFHSALRVALKEMCRSQQFDKGNKSVEVASFCCPGCFCSDPLEGDWCHARSWRPDSDNFTVASGCSGWVRAHSARWRHIPGPPDAVGGATMTMRPRELPEPCPGCNWESYRQPDKLWRELRRRQAHWPRWRLSQTQTNARLSPGGQSALTWHRSNPLNRFQLDSDAFLVCLRKSRRGAAAGPSGLTSDYLFPVLESEADSQLFAQVGSLLAIGKVFAPILEGIGLGRMTALKKPDGGVRGIVVGDIIRRLVARTMAKQVSKQVEAATAPFQYALSTKAGCECVAHILQCVTDEDPEATVISD